METGESQALRCFDLAAQAAEAYGRPDLVERVGAVRDRWLRPHLRVLVVGSFKQGKSTLVNALLGQDLCPTDDHVATAIPFVVRHGETDHAVEVHLDDEGTVTTVPLALEDVAGVVTATASRSPEEAWPVAVERTTPSSLLARGLELVDTPGTGGLDSRHAAATRAAFSTADAVLFVSDATQEMTAPELAVLHEAVAHAGAAAVVVTKADLSPSWRQLVALDRGHLDVAGMPIPVFPVSCTVRRVALASRSKEVNVESGFGEVARWLAALADAADSLADAIALADLEATISLLAQPHEATRDATADPDAGVALVDRLHEAEAAASQLRDAGRWQQLLGDGMTDLTAEVDHDFRDRMRTVTREAEALADEQDPADTWDDFESWLHLRVADEVVANSLLLESRAGELAARIEEKFGGEAGPQAVATGLGPPVAALEGLRAAPKGADLSKAGRTQTGITAVRGMQSGVLMFGMLGNIVGLTIAGPAVLGVGLVMGAKSVRDERRRQVTVRRQQAKQSVRKYVEEVQFQVGKDQRATMRQAQRLLRDHFKARASEAQRSAADALTAARSAVADDAETRRRRGADAIAELERLADFRRQCVAALGPSARTATTDAEAV